MNLMDIPQLITVDLTNNQQNDLISAQKQVWINFMPHLSQYKSPVASKDCRINLENTPERFMFNWLNMSDFWISGSINQTSCFPSSLLIEKSAFYINVPFKLTINENNTGPYI